MYRYFVLAAAVLMNLCLGATYSWSVFVGPLKTATGIGQGVAQIPFTLFYLAFPLTTILAHAAIRRRGPRACAMFGGVLFGCGWLVAGLGARHFAFVALGVGLLGGVGVGFTYLVPITTGMLWFPRHKGLVTGLAVSGFGGGAAAVARFASEWMQRTHASPFQTMALLGTVFLVAAPVAAAFLRAPSAPQAEPPPAPVGPGRSAEPADGATFPVLYFAMFTGLMAGFVVSANLKELRGAASREAGVMAVGLFAVANAAGRIAWGAAADRWRSIALVRVNLLAQAIVLLAAGWLLRWDGGLKALAFLVGFNYGGVLVLYASTVARLWGTERVAVVYGRLFSSNAPASLAPVLAGLAYDRWGRFEIPLAAVAGLQIAAAAILARRRPAPQIARATDSGR